jgi:hypothetical protein
MAAYADKFKTKVWMIWNGLWRNLIRLYNERPSHNSLNQLIVSWRWLYSVESKQDKWSTKERAHWRRLGLCYCGRQLAVLPLWSRWLQHCKQNIHITNLNHLNKLNTIHYSGVGRPDAERHWLYKVICLTATAPDCTLESKIGSGLLWVTQTRVLDRRTWDITHTQDTWQKADTGLIMHACN